MLNSILEAEEELRALQLPTDCSACVQEGSSSENRVLDAVHKAIRSTEFWSNGRNVVQVL